MAAFAGKQAFTRAEVRRLLRVSERLLRGWERQKLIPSTESYGFADLLALRTLVKLHTDKVPPGRIRLALSALHEKLRDVDNPLTELKIYSVGKRIRVDVEGQTMEPVSGQLLFNFDTAELTRLLEFPDRGAREDARAKRLSAERWFEKGLELEQAGAPVDEVIGAYQKAVELDPKSAGALVNLGTIYFNARLFAEAEEHYRKALDVDPDYALAHFDLGNLFDETGERSKALFHYQAALRINPSYADAHYNVALLYQSSNQPMKAVRHWRMYLKLDPGSHWAAIARRELARLRDAAIIPGARP